jgi:hypothetical protein
MTHRRIIDFWISRQAPCVINVPSSLNRELVSLRKQGCHVRLVFRRSHSAGITIDVLPSVDAKSYVIAWSWTCFAIS